MNLVMVGLFSFNTIGIEGAILQSLSHGFVASALFLCIAFVGYVLVSSPDCFLLSVRHSKLRGYIRPPAATIHEKGNLRIQGRMQIFEKMPQEPLKRVLTLLTKSRIPQLQQSCRLFAKKV